MTASEVKHCTRCDKIKPTSEFSRDTSRKDGLRPRCKACVRASRQANREHIVEYDREYRAANHERVIEKDLRYREANRERINERDRRYREANRERDSERKREYQATSAHGLTRTERDYIETIQLGRCPVCLDPLSRNAQVDHDHSCCPGEKSCGNCVRGIVHGRCNMIVGKFEIGALRDPELIELAAFYLAMTPQRMAPFYTRRNALAAA